tara:strand:+ start:3222 stop:4829 length:1608 start_codon:yes stop_codon:yes gene_type:complete
MNNQLFNTNLESITTNEAGGNAYAFSPKHELAQYISTGTFSDAYYVEAKHQLNAMLLLLAKLDTTFIAKAAIYSREQAHMKDAPALLCAYLATKDIHLLKNIFPRVIDNVKMLRNFTQIIRSGVTGRKSFGNAPKKLIQDFLTKQTPEQLLRNSVGKNPTLGDIIKMVHPKAVNPGQNAMFAYLTGNKYDLEYLPMKVRDYIRWRKGEEVSFKGVSWVPFQLLTGKKLSTDEWAEILTHANWHMTRMNINTAARHSVFDNHPEIITVIANRLKDPIAIEKNKVFPYQLLATYMNLSVNIPNQILDALEDAIQIALKNIPDTTGNVVICPDVSGSMSMSITGYRKGRSSKVKCIDAAALVASGFKWKALDRCTILPFDTKVHSLEFEPTSVLDTAKILSTYGGGGTNCACPLEHLNNTNHQADLVIFISDNESWYHTNRSQDHWPHRWDYSLDVPTTVAAEWDKYKVNNPNAKLVCIDVQPYDTTQISDRDDVLNIGGFSDNIFNTISKFINEDNNDSDSTDNIHLFVNEIENIDL